MHKGDIEVEEREFEYRDGRVKFRFHTVPKRDTFEEF